MTVRLQPHEMPDPRAPLYYGESFAGEVKISADGDNLIVHLNELAPLVRELIKAEMVSFEIVNIPAART